MQTLSYKGVTWVDLHHPSDIDIQFLRREHKIHESPLAELTRETDAPKIDRYEGQLYLVLYFPIFNYEKRTTEGREIDFILTKQALITCHNGQVEPLDEFHRMCDSDEGLVKQCFGDSPIHLLFILLSHLYDNSIKQLRHIKQNIDSIDDELFQDRRGNRGVVQRILETRRDILNFRRTLAPQRQILESLAERSNDLLGKRSRDSFDDLIEAYARVWAILESHKEAVEAIHETNDSLLTSKQNDTIQTLTVLSVITFYLTLVAAIFSTDTVYKPIVGLPYDFWWILGIMVATLGALLYYFKRKRWI